MLPVPSRIGVFKSTSAQLSLLLKSTTTLLYISLFTPAVSPSFAVMIRTISLAALCALSLALLASAYNAIH